jgi:hypothetical protein
MIVASNALRRGASYGVGFFQLLTGEKFKNRRSDVYMDIEKIEKILNVKIIATETIRGKVFPLFELFDLPEIKGLKLTLIKDPLFVVIDEEDIYEKRIKGAFIVVQKDNEHLLMKYEGEPNIETLRMGVENPKAEEVEQKEETDEDGKLETEEDGKEGGENQDGIEEILRKLPKWSDGAVVIEKDGNIIVLPIKKSKRGDSYYASVSWKPLNISRSVEDLISHVVMKNGKVVEADLRIDDKYVNIFIRNSRSRRR